MQQPMNQPEPIGGQQAVSQQMVLCPVRFVYETQVLVQPGDQIQPNQTFFINPQNPPPWMQNRPTPNPVVYVQQLPNNMVPVQQQMDQNQLYLQQNFANFQLQQHMYAPNHQEMRPTMQLANIVPNMIQNVQQNIQTNERNTNQNPNTGQMQANTQNMIQNQINVARQVQNPANQTVEVQRQVFMNVRPQMGQQMNIARPVMSLNQLQNMQAMANMQNLQIQQANAGQTFVQNIGQRPPQNVNAVRPQIMANNVMNVQNVNKPPTQETNKVMNNTVGSHVPNVRNFAQNYNCRPIQPRRRFVENNANIPKMQPQNVPVQTPALPQHIPVQTPPTQYNQDKVNSHQIVTNIAANTTYLNNPNISRKRKSESPDEILNKMAAPPATKPIYKNLQQGIIITKLCNEIGTNTSPVHKPNINVNSSAVQMNPNQPMVIVENAEQINGNPTKNITEARTPTTINTTVPTPISSESDKLIRNTVYTQARGRLLQDKISDNIPPQVIENKAPESVQNTTENRTNVEAQTEKDTVMTEVPSDKVITIIVQSEKLAADSKTEAETVESRINQTPENNPESKNIQTSVKKPADIKNEVVSNEVKVEVENKVSKTISDAQDEKSQEKEQNSEVKDENLEVKGKIVSKQDILTHVVDGYVIQESNFAFPIRKPLIEKTLHANPKAESESLDALKECMKEEMKNTGVDVQLLPFHYLLLHCEKKKEEEEKVDNKNLNPFTDLLHTTVKSWTVEDLSSHLLKYDWNETVSVFQDHEIDGESLFLVSKTQLRAYVRLQKKRMRRPVIQHSVRHSASQMNTTRQRTTNEVMNITYSTSTTETGVRNCNCRFRQNKRLLRHNNYSNNETAHGIQIQNISNQPSPINHLREHFEVYTISSIVYTEDKSENVAKEVESTEINSKNVAKDIETPENKSEISEKTEQELQGNDESKDVKDSNVADPISEGKYEILEANDETEQFEEILNVVPDSNPATSKNTSNNIINRETEILKNIIVENETKIVTNTKRSSQFDNFEVPKQIIHSKKRITSKRQPRFILTHVVSGYIIQESNVAFPVRQPQRKKRLSKKSNTAESAPIEEIKEEKVVEERRETNPFARLQHSTVKSWTVEDLSSHLLKFDWENTSSLLRDNDIDGSSLFLVTKAQLMIIGVKEDQAETIRGFVQNGLPRGN